MGHYERPFAEFKNLQFDFQIIIQTAKKGLRPTIPESCPEVLKFITLPYLSVDIILTIIRGGRH